MDNQSFVRCDNLVKIYKVADLEVVALQGLDLDVEAGEMMALIGPSGAGKSTLLNVIGGLDTPSAGVVEVGGWDLLQMSNRDRVNYKKEVVGFVWQQTARNLQPYLSARENVELPMMLAGKKRNNRKQRALELLEVVGLSERANFHPNQMSGGEQQRVALAVALANNPPLLLGDEMTGQIDSESSSQVYDALKRINEYYNTTIILVTHDPFVSGLVDRVVAIRDGRTSTEIRRRRDVESGDVDEEEWVILDQTGRMQLPEPYIDSLAMRERVKVKLEDDHVSVWPQHQVEAFIRLQTPEVSNEETYEVTYKKLHGPAVATKDLWRTYHIGEIEVHAVRDINLVIPSGKMVALKGPSGSGKTTLLNLIAGLDDPTEGAVAVGGRLLEGMSVQEKIDLRRNDIGFIFQTFGLLPFLSVEENVQIPLRLIRAPGKERNKRVAEVLSQVGLSERAKHRTYELSGGEQQRVAIARAMVNYPSLILADEPTGQLDTTTGAGIIMLLRDIVDKTGVTVIVASHDENVWQVVDIVYELSDGEFIGEYEIAHSHLDNNEENK
jgi:peptide/nickel transport system ATP-binding protein